jgi:hypothetical protein
MAQSATLTDVAAYQDYVQDFHDKLITRAFFSPETVQMSTTHEGVKGKKTLTRLKFVKGKAVAWSSSFSAATGAVSMHPRTIEVEAIKRDLSFVPQEFEDTYLGEFRKKGQNPGEDLPFEGYVLESILAGHAEELEESLWQAVKAGSITPGVTPMAQCFDGLLQIIIDEIAGGGIPGSAVVPTPGGAISESNIVALVEDMWKTLGAGYKKMPVDVYMSWNNFTLYSQAYRDQFGFSYGSAESARRKLDFSMNANLIPMPGMGESDRIVLTPRGNLHTAFDSFADTNMFEFEKNKRQMDFWMDFKVGVQIAQIDEAGLIVNDLE